ncbi:MAG: NUDIX domain-containing protein [Caldilineaceae bacterium]
MQASDQGTRHGGKHLAVPRTLIFLTSTNPATGADEVLLLQAKRRPNGCWAASSTASAATWRRTKTSTPRPCARLREETGLDVDALTLRGVVHIDTGRDEQGPRPGVMMFVFTGRAPARSVHATSEGAPAWIPMEKIADHALVDDLYASAAGAGVRPAFLRPLRTR